MSKYVINENFNDTKLYYAGYNLIKQQNMYDWVIDKAHKFNNIHEARDKIKDIMDAREKYRNFVIFEEFFIEMV
jgi:hypothetical protein